MGSDEILSHWAVTAEVIVSGLAGAGFAVIENAFPTDYLEAFRTVSSTKCCPPPVPTPASQPGCADGGSCKRPRGVLGTFFVRNSGRDRRGW
jgi:hypothetical protein